LQRGPQGDTCLLQKLQTLDSKIQQPYRPLRTTIQTLLVLCLIPFKKISFSSKGHSKSSNDTIKISTLSDKEGDSHNHKISRFEGHPFLDLHKNGYFE